MEKADCHIHMVLSGEDFRLAIARHRSAPEDGWIHAVLSRYRAAGFTYLRDGGDRWGVGLRAKALAPEYGICYRTPLAPLYRAGHYGSFIGTPYRDLQEYTAQVDSLEASGGDFVKLMLSGLMDFNRFGVLTEPDEPPENLHDLVSVAHDRGFGVMVHCNGARTAQAAAKAGVDSIEHGAYLDEAALEAMAFSDTVWVPTLSTIGNLLGKGRFPDGEVHRILDSALENVARYAALGGKIAPGTDAGAWAVPHGGDTEYRYLRQALGEAAPSVLDAGIACIRAKF